jgi:hypothetical protein
MKILVIACTLLVAHSIRSTVNIKLEYTFRVGDQFVITQATKQTMMQSVMGMAQPGVNTYTGVMSLKVFSLTNTGAKLEAKFLALKNRSQTILGDITMDSDGPNNSTGNRAFKAITQKTFFVIIDTNGKVRDIENSENLWTGISALGMDSDEEMKLRESLGQWLNKNALISNVEQAMVYYDGKKVSPGDTWISRSQFPMDFPIQIDNTWNLTTLDGSTAMVKAQGTYTTTDREKVLTLPNGMKTKVDFTGKQQLESSVDTKTGWPISLRIDAKLNGKMTMLAGGFLPQDMEMPTIIETGTTYTYDRK